MLPLGISFITFQKIAYLVDAYYGKAKEYDLVSFSLFVLFFPQLIAGPIVHHKEIIPQFQDARGGLKAEHVAVGLTIFAIGLFKKVVFADQAGQYGNAVFSSVHAGDHPQLWTAWGGALAYTLQLYFDFSGYSDMAIGLARMFGVRLPLNFDSPYKARNIIDFWRRWHMTLSRFLRDYVYIPLGGSQRGPARRYANLMATMLIGGFWHGAGWTFVFWGALHGYYLMSNHAWRHIAGNRPWASHRMMVPLYHCITLLAVVIGWVFFRASTFSDAITLLVGMAGGHGAAWPPELQGILSTTPLAALGFADLGFSLSGYIWIVALLLIALFVPNSQEIMRLSQPSLSPVESESRIVWRPSFRWAIVTGVVLVMTFMCLNRVSEFLYFQF